jgi:GLPGLI family protein
MYRIFFLLIALAPGSIVFAQVKAKAISYQVEGDLRIFAPDAVENIQDPVCKFEVDAYYTGTHVKTMVRTLYVPKEFPVNLRQRFYETQTKDEYNLDHENKFMLLKKDQNFKLKSTGKKKTILGYACKEFTFQDYRKVNFSIWVTEALGTNVCPAGNFSVKGTVLELTASNGFHYTAVDFAEGVVDETFFVLPTGYTQEISNPPAATNTK